MLPIQVKIIGLRDYKGRFSNVSKVIVSKRRQAIKEFIPSYISVLKQYAPVKSGKFRESFYGKSFGENGREVTVRFYSRDPKTPFVIQPTSAHTITAVRAKALRFWVGDSKVFAKSVLHPGTKGSNFVERAFGDQGGRDFVRAMNKVSVQTVAYLAKKGGGAS